MFGLMLWLMACHPMALPLQDAAQAPSIADDRLLVGDGTALPMRRWLPDGEPRAVLLALHGFNDYSHAFAYAGEYFSVRGVAVYAYDQRGFGANEQTGLWPGRDNLTRDVVHAMQAIKQAHPETPLFVVGESMGGAVLIAACAEYGCEEAEGLILAAPALWGEDFVSRLSQTGLWVLAHTIPSSMWTARIWRSPPPISSDFV